MQFYLKGNPKS